MNLKLKAFPLFCPKRSVKNFIIETDQPDAKTQC